MPDAFHDATGAAVALGYPARATAALAAWMIVWWMTEAIPIYATALMPVALLPLFQVLPVSEAAAPYGHHLIFLILGGFILSLSMERWRLHARIALAIVRLVGTRPDRIVGGFMLASASISMWLSNTATTVMMLPIALSVAAIIDTGVTPAKPRRNFTVCLLLGVAYGASIGGIGTIVGTPPNAFLVSYVANTYGVEISFLRWLAVGLPVTGLLLPLAWWSLTRVSFRIDREQQPGTAAAIRAAWDDLGPVSRGEKLTAAVFAVTGLAWIARPVLNTLEIAGTMPLAGLDDTNIAVLAALATFVIPVHWRQRLFLLDWQHASCVPWGILILCGGGLSLAAAVQNTGLAVFLAGTVHFLDGLPPWLIVLALTSAILMLTEITSNLATTMTLVPILAAIAPGLGLHPYLLIVPTTLAVSCAFMLPIATPPNAIVFASGRLHVKDMIRAGLLLNVVAAVLITTLTYRFVLRVL
ncbi:MAG: SLC13/DASS family transporter [Gammaproteobacteria bacterium]|nr:SLC13/DASS family transporter [Gammaproteobacteria bacterium]